MSIATDISGQLAAATETIALPVSGYGTAGFQIAGTYSGTITFEGTVDGYTYQTLYATPTNSTTAATSTTSTGVWTAPVAGLFGIRLRMSAYASGTASVKILSAVTGGGSSGGGGGGGAVTIADGADVAEGATTDAAVGDSSGTVNSHQRFVAKVLSDVWNSVSHYLAVSIQNATLAVTQSGTWTLTAASLTPAAPTAATVGVTSAAAVAASAGRKQVELLNTSANFISLGFGANAAVLYSGITMTPYGYVKIDNAAVAALAINAIASAASSNLGVQSYT